MQRKIPREWRRTSPTRPAVCSPALPPSGLPSRHWRLSGLWPSCPELTHPRQRPTELPPFFCRRKNVALLNLQRTFSFPDTCACFLGGSSSLTLQRRECEDKQMATTQSPGSSLWWWGRGGRGGGVLDRRYVLDLLHGRSRMTTARAGVYSLSCIGVVV